MADLVEAITDWARRWNENPKPSYGTAADEIIDKVRRGGGTQNFGPDWSHHKSPALRP